MKNHRFVELVAQTMLNLNSDEYINDIRELIITNNDYQNYNIDVYLNSILNILQTHIINSSQQFNENGYRNNDFLIKLSLKKYLFKILDVNNDNIGMDCCKILLCNE
jgi:hypothetical protein